MKLQLILWHCYRQSVKMAAVVVHSELVSFALPTSRCDGSVYHQHCHPLSPSMLGCFVLWYAPHPSLLMGAAQGLPKNHQLRAISDAAAGATAAALATMVRTATAPSRPHHLDLLC